MAKKPQPTKPKIAWKFLAKGLRSVWDDSQWRKGEWRSVPPPRRACIGLNASKTIIDALYVIGCSLPIIAKVEYSGKVVTSSEKITCEKMRILQHWKFTKAMKKSIIKKACELRKLDLDKEEYCMGFLLVVNVTDDLARHHRPTALKLHNWIVKNLLKGA